MVKALAKQNEELIRQAYTLYKQGLMLKDIAAKLKVKESTVRSWKRRYNWDDDDAMLQRNATKKTVPVATVVKETSANTELTEKEKLFCLYFVKCFNASKAYYKAYEGCEYSSAQVGGCRLLKKDKIKAEIDRLKQDKLNRAFLSQDDIFQKYIDIAFADITDYVSFGRETVPVMGPFGPVTVKGDDGNKVQLEKEINSVKFKESAKVDGTLITEVKQGRDGASIKLADKMKALEWLAEHSGLLTEEQRAKIDKLRKDAQDDNRDRNVTIRFADDDLSDYAD